MPVIVVGADTDTGRAIVDGLAAPDRELRAFVSDEDVAMSLKRTGIKVALGDVSDESHVEAASTDCFSAVLVAEAAFDGREQSFANTPDQVLLGWANAVEEARVKRLLWITDVEVPSAGIAEIAIISAGEPGLVDRVVALDDAQTITNDPSI